MKINEAIYNSDNTRHIFDAADNIERTGLPGYDQSGYSHSFMSGINALMARIYAICYNGKLNTVKMNALDGNKQPYCIRIATVSGPLRTAKRQ